VCVLLNLERVSLTSSIKETHFLCLLPVPPYCSVTKSRCASRGIGVSIYSSKYGTYPTWGEIGKCYERFGGTASRLGFPTSPELSAKPSPRKTAGWVQHFEGGRDSSKGWSDTHEVSIYASRHGAHPVWGEIAEHYEALGGTGSSLGFPTSAEEWLNGWIQHFEGGDLRQ
jgi:hypothetical protein